MSADEYRRAPRRKVPHTIHVIDTMTDDVVGRLGNLSETGMLLIASAPLVDDALYQFRFNLAGTDNQRGTTIEVGAHLLWKDAASAADQTWTGFRFISVPERQLQQIKHWLAAPNASYE